MSAEEITAIVWLVVAVGLFIAEGLTVQLVSVWFAFGALVAMVASLLGAGVTVQLLAFFVTSLAVLLLFRPLVKKRLDVKKSATNADVVIGQVGIVQETIDNDLQTGRVHANGLDWTARSAQPGIVIPAGSRVVALRIEGVKLIVEPATKNAQVPVAAE